MTTRSSNPLWVLQKTVLVYTPDFKACCSARLRIAHDKTANRGSISLRFTAELANLSGRSQVLTLNIPPEIVEKCELARISNVGLCSSDLLPKLPAPVTNLSAVSTLSLILNKTGRFLCPSGVESLSPANQEDLDLDAFAKICQSTSLRLHFSKRQFVEKELNQLEFFSGALRSLQAEHFDYARHGVVQKDWPFSLLLDPPPYSEERVSDRVKQVDPPLYSEQSEQAVGKRPRDLWSMSPDDERRKRLLLTSPEPLGSPTEVNTPSTTHSPSASIRPTYFTHTSSPGRTKRNRLARLEDELRGASDDWIRQLLIRLGREHLLATPQDVDSDRPSESEKVRFANVGMMESHLKQYVDEMIERRLKSHIVDEIVDRAVSECREQIFDECKMHEAGLGEKVDDANSEIHNTANECMKEIEAQAQKHMGDIEEHAQQYMNDIEDQGVEIEMSAEKNAAKLKRWFNSAQSLLDSKSEPGTKARRISI
ncbi:hypothetical protein DTO013E5_3339 [Penicillium roqueforti]|uniref:Genomic scaffold, ProqFM164S03 n=1 Tax=Penicillium roqueforti (strain FM164) TaxID=1365484 RepID=W6QE60_PENRF|nr:uncharacterized protein LCP9604111_5893 [Penicillium roqueforti]CDM34745.1 unnamed protein product [Penicillium roqueforti FM164]KAF9247703.1 hypothetical protein LCP9604111_5893 [Penicillium roqueforti]KAI2704523.1 hypothetical protein CBS147372_2992 [Penicillium roqueforti]KAI2744073.1 hypothetical protein DTO012A1_3059 [Penicillium roqueforti]KAI2756302.1 hypothetical protein DTO013F2_1050 [Penicillium roqueforti]